MAVAAYRMQERCGALDRLRTIQPGERSFMWQRAEDVVQEGIDAMEHDACGRAVQSHGEELVQADAGSYAVEDVDEAVSGAGCGVTPHHAGDVGRKTIPAMTSVAMPGLSSQPACVGPLYWKTTLENVKGEAVSSSKL